MTSFDTPWLNALALVALCLALPSTVEAQVGTCSACDPTLVNACVGAENGAEQCAQHAPHDCDLYGDVCSSGYSSLDIAPDGSPWAPTVVAASGGLGQPLTAPYGPTTEMCGNRIIRPRVEGPGETRARSLLLRIDL